jgi:hypothetical protein
MISMLNGNNPCNHTSTMRANLFFSGEETLVVSPYQPAAPTQQWELRGPHIYLRNSDRVVDIADHNREPGARLTMWETTGANNQEWDVEYLYVRHL